LVKATIQCFSKFRLLADGILKTNYIIKVRPRSIPMNNKCPASHQREIKYDIITPMFDLYKGKIWFTALFIFLVTDSNVCINKHGPRNLFSFASWRLPCRWRGLLFVIRARVEPADLWWLVWGEEKSFMTMFMVFEYSAAAN